MFLNYTNTKITAELRELVENGVDIWDFEYPSYYTGADKTAFEKKVIDHFYFRQIGQETPARWLHYFRSRVREIMPYYLQLYKLEENFAKIEDPFESYNLTEEYTETVEGNGKTTVNSDTSSTATTTGDSTKTDNTDREGVKKFSNTPQGTISNIDSHLTEATVDDEKLTQNQSENSTGTSTATGSATDETESENSQTVTHKLERYGNIGVQPLGQEIVTLRNAFINIDQMIINDLNDLFIQIY